MRNNIHYNLIKTLSYSDIFDYPLTKGEIYHFFKGKNFTGSEIYTGLERLQSLDVVNNEKGFYFLKGRKKIVSLRTDRKKYALHKYKKAERIIKLLSIIPTVECIAVTGSLASKNTKKKDDIDLFFITSPHSLWLTRCLITVFLLLLGEKRSRRGKNVEDKICPNMFISLHDLSLPEKNLFVAHELSQMFVMYNKHDAYEQLLSSNKWLNNYLPHVRIKTTPGKHRYFTYLLFPLELLCYVMQKNYMSSRITNEIVGPHIAKFHPKRIQQKVLKKYYYNTAFYTTIFVMSLEESEGESRRLDSNLSVNITPGS